MLATEIIKNPDFKSQYRSIGVITARLISDKNEHYLEIGAKKFPAIFHPKFKRWLQKNTITNPQTTFTVYLKSIKEEPYYSFCIVGIYDQEGTYNHFSIRGLIKKWDYPNKVYYVEIRRNKRDKDKPAPKQKFNVRVVGIGDQPQKDCLLAFADLQCCLEDSGMVVKSSSMIYKPNKKTNSKTPILKKKITPDAKHSSVGLPKPVPRKFEHKKTATQLRK